MQDTPGETRTNSSVMYSYGPPHMAKQKQDDQLEHTYSSYVRIRDVALKTCQKRWMIGRSGERGSGISVLVARHDDDGDDEFIYSSIKKTMWTSSNSMIFAWSSWWNHNFRLDPVRSLKLSSHELAQYLSGWWFSHSRYCKQPKVLSQTKQSLVNKKLLTVDVCCNHNIEWL